MKKIFITICAILSVFTANAKDVAPEKPNVVLILVDDLGQQDVVCYDLDNSIPYETPFMDSLSKKGVMFTQGYSPAPTCAPTRSAIMSGLHPARTNLTHVSGGFVPTPNLWKSTVHISPYYKGHGAGTVNTLPKVLKDNGYITGHSGKWHMGTPATSSAKSQGFDFSASSLGVTSKSPDRSKIFATKEAGGKYQLGDDGLPIDAMLEDALDFLDMANKTDKPFFLYFSTFLVHYPIHSSSRELLEKYCKKMGVPFPTDPSSPLKRTDLGQKNPYYAAMVELLDSYCAKLYKYLEETDDPRWKGHKLVENTYIIFASDNGGMEGDSTERYTDNAPLQKGKISAMEGGIRVPLFIMGPNIPKGVKSDVLINGLDFYPTIMSWTKSKIPQGKRFDGCDLSNFLAKDPTDSNLVIGKNNKPRDTLMWHFPNANAQESTIRIGDYKLVRNYFEEPKIELFRLYDSQKKENVDIGEENNLADKMPEKAAQMDKILTEMLREMGAVYPHRNPYSSKAIASAKNIPSVLSHTANDATGDVEFTVKENGAKIVRADLIFRRLNADKKHPWEIQRNLEMKGDKVKAKLPENTTHYYLNLIDENDFLECYPHILDKDNTKYTDEISTERAIKTPLAAKIVSKKKKKK